MNNETNTGGAQFDTVEAIRSWPIVDGWHVEPVTGRHVRIGNGVEIGDGVTIGYDVEIGNWVILPSVNIANYTANPCSPGTIRIGCHIHSVDKWRQNAKQIMAEERIDPTIESALLAQFEWLAGWFDAYPEAMTIKEADNG